MQTKLENCIFSILKLSFIQKRKKGEEKQENKPGLFKEDIWGGVITI